MNQVSNVKKVDILPLSNDYVFKRISGKGGNERILKSLLEAILKISIQKIEIKNPEIPKETINEFHYKTKFILKFSNAKIRRNRRNKICRYGI